MSAGKHLWKTVAQARKRQLMSGGMAPGVAAEHANLESRARFMLEMSMGREVARNAVIEVREEADGRRRVFARGTDDLTSGQKAFLNGMKFRTSA